MSLRMTKIVNKFIRECVFDVHVNEHVGLCGY